MQTSNQAIVSADTAEVAARLAAQGLTGVLVVVQGGTASITADQGDDAVAAALSGWVPKTLGPMTFDPGVPQSILDAVAEMRLFMAVPNGTATAAQRDAVVKDVIRCLAFLNNRLS